MKTTLTETIVDNLYESLISLDSSNNSLTKQERNILIIAVQNTFKKLGKPLDVTSDTKLNEPEFLYGVLLAFAERAPNTQPGNNLRNFIQNADFKNQVIGKQKNAVQDDGDEDVLDDFDYGSLFGEVSNHPLENGNNFDPAENDLQANTQHFAGVLDAINKTFEDSDIVQPGNPDVVIDIAADEDTNPQLPRQTKTLTAKHLADIKAGIDILNAPSEAQGLSPEQLLLLVGIVGGYVSIPDKKDKFKLLFDRDLLIQKVKALVAMFPANISDEDLAKAKITREQVEQLRTTLQNLYTDRDDIENNNYISQTPIYDIKALFESYIKGNPDATWEPLSWKKLPARVLGQIVTFLAIAIEPLFSAFLDISTMDAIKEFFKNIVKNPHLVTSGFGFVITLIVSTIFSGLNFFSDVTNADPANDIESLLHLFSKENIKGMRKGPALLTLGFTLGFMVFVYTAGASADAIPVNDLLKKWLGDNETTDGINYGSLAFFTFLGIIYYLMFMTKKTNEFLAACLDLIKEIFSNPQAFLGHLFKKSPQFAETIIYMLIYSLNRAISFVFIEGTVLKDILGLKSGKLYDSALLATFFLSLINAFMRSYIPTLNRIIPGGEYEAVKWKEMAAEMVPSMLMVRNLGSLVFPTLETLVRVGATGVIAYQLSSPEMAIVNTIITTAFIGAHKALFVEIPRFLTNTALDRIKSTEAGKSAIDARVKAAIIASGKVDQLDKSPNKRLTPEQLLDLLSQDIIAERSEELAGGWKTKAFAGGSAAGARTIRATAQYGFVLAILPYLVSYLTEAGIPNATIVALTILLGFTVSVPDFWTFYGGTLEWTGAQHQKNEHRLFAQNARRNVGDQEAGEHQPLIPDAKQSGVDEPAVIDVGGERRNLLGHGRAALFSNTTYALAQAGRYTVDYFHANCDENRAVVLEGEYQRRDDLPAVVTRNRR